MQDSGGNVGSKLATEDMNTGTARDDSKLPSCPCKDPTCPSAHGSAGCQVRMPRLCQVCKAHADKQAGK